MIRPISRKLDGIVSAEMWNNYQGSIKLLVSLIFKSVTCFGYYRVHRTYVYLKKQDVSTEESSWCCSATGDVDGSQEVVWSSIVNICHWLVGSVTTAYETIHNTSSFSCSRTIPEWNILHLCWGDVCFMAGKPKQCPQGSVYTFWFWNILWT